MEKTDVQKAEDRSRIQRRQGQILNYNSWIFAEQKSPRRHREKINVGGGAQPGSSRCRCQEEIEEGTEPAATRPAKAIQAD